MFQREIDHSFILQLPQEVVWLFVWEHFSKHFLHFFAPKSSVQLKKKTDKGLVFSRDKTHRKAWHNISVPIICEALSSKETTLLFHCPVAPACLDPSFAGWSSWRSAPKSPCFESPPPSPSSCTAPHHHWSHCQWWWGAWKCRRSRPKTSGHDGTNMLRAPPSKTFDSHYCELLRRWKRASLVLRSPTLGQEYSLWAWKGSFLKTIKQQKTAGFWRTFLLGVWLFLRRMWFQLHEACSTCRPCV